MGADYRIFFLFFLFFLFRLANVGCSVWIQRDVLEFWVFFLLFQVFFIGIFPYDFLIASVAQESFLLFLEGFGNLFLFRELLQREVIHCLHHFNKSKHFLNPSCDTWSLNSNISFIFNSEKYNKAKRNVRNIKTNHNISSLYSSFIPFISTN